EYNKLLDLINYSSFDINQGILTLNNHYSCIPQTPLYYLCRQRIKSFADEIKFKLVHRQNKFQ
ncbi:unnamed protein product, partial [Rotaria sp. Silwood2]